MTQVYESFKKYFIVYAITIVLIFLPLAPSTQPTPYSHSQSPCHCPCPWVMHICSLTNPFTFFQPVPSLPFPLTAVSLFHVSLPLVLFCSLINFVNQVPVIGEIIWYLSFTDWLVSLSIIVSRSIHVVAKGKNSIFFTAAQYSIM